MFISKKKMNTKGFTLVEILISIGILAIVIVTLSLNMITSVQMNSLAKQSSEASDLTDSIIEAMHAVNLSDVLTEVYGYSTDEYGAPLKSSLLNTALKNYDVGQKNEVVYQNGEYVLATNKTGVVPSVIEKDFGNGLMPYFVGQDNDKYAFLLSNVKNKNGTGNSYIDILTVIEPIGAADIVDVSGVSQSSIVSFKQMEGLDESVAQEFKNKHDVYMSTNGKTAQYDYDWFFKRLEKIVKVSLLLDTITDEIIVQVNVEYKIDLSKYPDCLDTSDSSTTKSIGNTIVPTSKASNGIYVYYYPLVNDEYHIINGLSSQTRDSFEVYNTSNISTPIYLIRIGNNTEEFESEYRPNIFVQESMTGDGLSTGVDTVTTICSNIPDINWIRSVAQFDKVLTIHPIADSNKQSNLYKITVYAYKHNSDSYDIKTGTFSPKEKDLLNSTSSTFIDRS